MQNLMFNVDCNVLFWKGSREYEVVFKEFGNLVLNFGVQYFEVIVFKDEFCNKGVYYNIYLWSILKSVEDCENLFVGVVIRVDVGWYVWFVD